MATRTRLQIVQAVADALGLRESGTATGGTVTTVVAAAYPFLNSRTNANAKAYEGAEIYITSSNWAGTAGNPNLVKTYAPSTGTFTVAGESYAGDTPASGDTFDIYLHGVRKADIDDALNRALRARRYLSIYPLTIVAGGDMHDAVVADWTATNATRALITTAAGVWRGKQSLEVTASAALGQAQSAATVKPAPSRRTGYYARALVSAPTGTARFSMYDVTNSTVLSTKDWGDEGWGILDFNFDVASTTRDFAPRLISVANNDVTVWNYAQVLPIGANEVALPSWVSRKGQIRRVFRARPGAELPDADDMDEYRWWRVVEDFANANNQFRLRLDPPIEGPVFFEASREFADVSTDSSTVSADRTWIELATAVELLQKLVNAPGPVNQDYYRKELVWRQVVLNSMDRNLLPEPIIDDTWSEPF